MSDGGPLVFLIAGEPSGDALGASLMAGLKAARPGVRFAGIGGERMAEAGLQSLFPMKELSIMGLAEILPKIPALLRRIKETATEVKRLRPDAVVTIDAPDFCFRVAKRLKGKGIPIIHWVAPSVWAWRPGRAAKVAGLVDHLMTLLPFEPPYFEREGLPTTFVGHPVVESGAGKGDADRFRHEWGIADDDELLCVLPGSRKGEITRLLPVFRDAVAMIKTQHPNLRVVVPTVPSVAYDVRMVTAHWPVPTMVVEGDCAKYDAFAASKAALAASGTVSLELALAGLPTVIAYKVHPISAWLARRLIKLRWVTLVNILLGTASVPELLQEACTPERLATSVHVLLADPVARKMQQDDSAKALEMLGYGGPSPGRRAAETVLHVIDTFAREA